MEWISVKDKLPEEGENVLIYEEAYSEVGYLFRGKWRSMETDFCGEPYELEDVTHWMYLPEPPKK